MKYGLTWIVPGEQRPVRIRKRYMGDTRHSRETLLLRALAGGESERTHRAPVESTEKSDEARASTDIARQFQCAFHRFSAGLAEETEHWLAHRRERIYFFAECDLLFMRKIRRNVEELIGRILDRLNHQRV